MPEEYLPFHSFYDPSPVTAFTEKLSENGIDFKIENNPGVLDQTFIGVSSGETITIKLKSKDFKRAHECLADYYSADIDAVDNSYYLFSFSDAELVEIVTKPDEWGYFDYQLAQKILKDRNYVIDQGMLENLKAKRNDELAKPKKASASSYVIGYFIVFLGLMTLLSGELNQYSFSYLIVTISGLIGSTIYKSRKTLPNGEVVFSYEEYDRKNGKILMYISIIVIIACTVRLLILLSL
jgi:hypothetical protein